jgi:hypothetical protein
VVLYYQPQKVVKKLDIEKEKELIEKTKQRFGIN